MSPQKKAGEEPIFLSALAFMVGIFLGAPGTSLITPILTIRLLGASLLFVFCGEISKKFGLGLFVLLALGALSPKPLFSGSGPGSATPLFVLSRYQEIGSSLFRTDEDGAVELLSDGRTTGSGPTFDGERTYRGFLLKKSSPPLPGFLLL